MPSHLKAAQAHYDYFFNMQNATPPDSKWSVGLEFSRRWLEYFKKDNDQKDYQEFISIIKAYMPYRNSGTGFRALWSNLLGFVSTLPVNVQKDVWLENFDTSNQGEKLVEYNDEAIQTVRKWVELANSYDTLQFNENMMAKMVDEIYTFSYSSDEWLVLTAAISKWFKSYVDKPSLFDVILNRYKASSSHNSSE